MSLHMLWFLKEYFLPYSFLIVLSYLYLKFTAVNVFNKRATKPKSNQTLLFFTAHPDDECMFFSPTILGLIEEGHRVYVTCFTKGNFYGQGDTRPDELISSCKQLGVPEKNVNVIDNSHFPDDPNVRWDSEKLGDEMISVIQRIIPNFIITFDEGGVSGHSNHKDLFRAVKQLVDSKRLSKDIGVLTLDSCSLLRKYISWLDVPFSAMTSYLTFVTSPSQLRQGWRAMSAHHSQMMWFRKLYIICSRYMLVNTLTEITTER